jgi:hypothetical protein
LVTGSNESNQLRAGITGLTIIGNILKSHVDLLELLLSLDALATSRAVFELPQAGNHALVVKDMSTRIYAEILLQ